MVQTMFDKKQKKIEKEIWNDLIKKNHFESNNGSDAAQLAKKLPPKSEFRSSIPIKKTWYFCQLKDRKDNNGKNVRNCLIERVKN